MKKIYLDANFSPHFATAFNAFEASFREIEVLSTAVILGDSAPDEDIIKHIAKENAYLISLDKDFKRLRGIREIIEKNKIGWFFYKGGDQPHWSRVKHMVSAWDSIRRKVLSKNLPRPFCYHIHANGNFNNQNMLE